MGDEAESLATIYMNDTRHFSSTGEGVGGKPFSAFVKCSETAGLRQAYSINIEASWELLDSIVRTREI
jgi:hypothetical protein